MKDQIKSIDTHFKFSNSVIGLPLLFVFILWFIYWLEVRFDFDFDFDENGIFPRTFSGLQGIVFSPFIHSNIEHLYNNSIPLLVLLAALRYFYRAQSLAILGYGILFSGLITWIIGRDSYHIGASGLVYVLVSFIFFKGIQTKYYRLIALSLTVIVFYGSMIWYVFPNPSTMGEVSISWESHLSGLITGFFLSVLYKTPEFKKVIKYDWEHPEFNASEDKFMQRFDENGNFMNLPIPEDDRDEQTENGSFFVSNSNVKYDIILNNTDIKKKNESEPES